MRLLVIVTFAFALIASSPCRSETPDEWIKLGTRIHGRFGVLIPIGIRIGLDAQDRLKTDARELQIIYFTGEKSPCSCIADGVMIATQASPGKGTLQIAARRAPRGSYAIIVIRNRKTGQTLRYTISDEWAPKILDWNRSLDPAGRYAAAMNADGLFQVAPLQ